MFKKGDVVRVIDVEGVINAITLHKEYVILKDQIGDAVRLVNDNRMRNPAHGEYWFAYRFELVEEQAHAIIAPEQVRCIEGLGVLKRKKIYTVKKRTDKAIYLVEIPGNGYALRRFEPVVEAPVAPRPFAVGDMVYVTAKVDPPDGGPGTWVREMNQYLNDGIAKEITHLGGDYARLANDGGPNWNFRLECLSHAPGVAKPPEPKAPKPPPPPKPVYAGDIRATLRAKKAEDGSNEHTITSFALLKVNAKEPEFFIDPACYAAINRFNDPITQFAIDTTGHAHQLIGDNRKACVSYFNYLFNTSPWACCFITKDAEEALEKGILMDCNRTISELVGAAITVREATEYSARLDMFQEVLDKGYSGNVAYLMSVSFCKQGKGYSQLAACGGHCALTTSMSKEALITFFAKSFQYGGKPANQPGRGQYAIFVSIDKDADRYHGNSKGLSFYNWTTTESKVRTIGTGWQAKTVVEEKSMYEFATLLQQTLEQVK